MPKPKAAKSKIAAPKRYARHPYSDAPSAQEIEKAAAAFSPSLAKPYLELHQLVLGALPDVRYSLDLKDGSIGYGANQYGADGWGIAVIACYSKWLNLAFFQGATLPDPRRLLEGTGARVRHVKVRSQEELEARRTALKALVRAAAGKATKPGSKGAK